MPSRFLPNEQYKVAGGIVLGTVIPWMVSYAVSNDPGSRRLVGKVSPALGGSVRQNAVIGWEGRYVQRLECDTRLVRCARALRCASARVTLLSVSLGVRVSAATP